MTKRYCAADLASPSPLRERLKQQGRKNAAGLILAHNHPEGGPAPSPDDLALTKAVRKAGHLMKERKLGFS